MSSITPTSASEYSSDNAAEYFEKLEGTPDEVNAFARKKLEEAQLHFGNKNYADSFKCAQHGLVLHPTDQAVLQGLHIALIVADSALQTWRCTVS